MSQASPPAPSRSPLSAVAIALSLLTLVAVGACWWRIEAVMASQAEADARAAERLDEVLGEVTRMRIEASADQKGVAGLLEKLAVYAPLTSDARVTEPDYQNAQKELRAVVRAFEATGEDRAWQPVVTRIEEADVRKDFDELKWLLEIAIRLDPPAGKQIAKEVLLGQRKPNPRLRLWAAEILLDHDKPLARTLLRQVLHTETSRGIDMNRAAAYGATIPDQAAYVQSGFNNFVQLYLQSEDPRTDETLMQVLGRVEHDKITLQDCIKALGERKCEKAVDQIKRLYDNPPLNTPDFFFLRYCAQAVADIQGLDALPWLEQKLQEAEIDTIANALAAIIKKLR